MEISHAEVQIKPDLKKWTVIKNKLQQLSGTIKL